jgi:hypothetical protein
MFLLHTSVKPTDACDSLSVPDPLLGHVIEWQYHSDLLSEGITYAYRVWNGVCLLCPEAVNTYLGKICLVLHPLYNADYSMENAECGLEDARALQCCISTAVAF